MFIFDITFKEWEETLCSLLYFFFYLKYVFVTGNLNNSDIL